MNILIYFIIAVLYGVLILWVWNNTKDFEDKTERIMFITGGIIVLGIITFILFSISKIGIKYPNKEVLSQVRKMSVLLFIPLNGFVSLPHIAKIKTDIKNGNENDEKNKNRIIILAIIIITVSIIQIFYLKDFQKGIIAMINR